MGKLERHDNTYILCLFVFVLLSLSFRLIRAGLTTLLLSSVYYSVKGIGHLLIVAIFYNAPIIFW
jgi:hypothetical protein